MSNDVVFPVGITASHHRPHSRAQPIDRLQQKHLEFQHRMVRPVFTQTTMIQIHLLFNNSILAIALQARRIQRKAQQGAEEGASTDGPSRPTLGVIKQRRGLVSAPPRYGTHSRGCSQVSRTHRCYTAQLETKTRLHRSTYSKTTMGTKKE